METETPARTTEQRMNALARANRVRIYRAGVKRDVKSGRRDVLAVLLDPAPELETMKVWDLLLAAPRLGRVKIAKLFQHQGISPSKTVGGLTERQRAAVAAWLEARHVFATPTQGGS